jgi:hypothetical protein
MGPSELACARCGRHVPVAELTVWQQYEERRVFQGPGRSVDGGPPRPVYDRVRKHCAYLTCRACHERLEAGGRLDDIHNRKVAAYAAGVVALGLLIVVFTPIVLPRLLIAFWWW